MRLDGKVAVVTGGGSGIGEGIVMCMAKEGADIAIPDIQEGNAQVGRGKSRRWAARPSAMRCDVTKAAEIGAAFDRIKGELGRIDILVNNAGMASPPGMPFTVNTEEDWDRTYEVNLKSVFLTSKAHRAILHRAQGRAHHQHRLDRGAAGGADDAAVLGGQGRGHHLHARGGQGAGAARDHRQRDLPGRALDRVLGGAGQVHRGYEPRLCRMSARQVFDKRVADVIPMKREQTPEDIGWAAVFLASEAGAEHHGPGPDGRRRQRDALTAGEGRGYRRGEVDTRGGGEGGGERRNDESGRSRPRAGPARPGAGAWAQAAGGRGGAEPVMRQLEAFRRDDFDTAYHFASGSIRPAVRSRRLRADGAARLSGDRALRLRGGGEGGAGPPRQRLPRAQDPRRQRPGRRGASTSWWPKAATGRSTPSSPAPTAAGTVRSKTAARPGPP